MEQSNTKILIAVGVFATVVAVLTYYGQLSGISLIALLALVASAYFAGYFIGKGQRK